ncbi:MAG: type 2 isopentenyl-diphosphate Delta-isomerase [Saprospiraceae bacterium]
MFEMDKLDKNAGLKNEDPTSSERKQDHIVLAFKSRITQKDIDQRFYYEPLLAAHPKGWENLVPFDFLGKKVKVPLWVSSMTGGTEWARVINQNLARACAEFGMGLGLGSCRSLLYADDTFADFNVRPIIGDDLPLFANLGIAQVEQLLKQGALGRIDAMLDKLRADGLIVHVNPFQEWLQPEGDRFSKPPIETIEALLDKAGYPIVVKEVGQGFGMKSLEALLKLPLAAIDFGASGGTNFAMLELLRSDEEKMNAYLPLSRVGHSAEEMVDMCNQLVGRLGDAVECRQVIISGGVADFLDGHYLLSKLTLPAVYGQASAFLKHARGDYEQLQRFVAQQLKGLALAKAYLTPKV